MKSGPEQFKEWMARRGLNQAQTAVHFGWSEPIISMLATGKRSPGLRRAVKIERETGIPVEAWLSSAVDNDEEPVGSSPSKSLVNKAGR
jgi:transcriptional regulator with XRE-family HTH domain